MNYQTIKEAAFEQNRFESISDFKWNMRCGGEAVFLWRGKQYGVVRYGKDKKITVYEVNNIDSQICYETADDALEYMLGEDRLRDVITRVTVIERTI